MAEDTGIEVSEFYVAEDIGIELSEFYVIIAWMKSVVIVSHEQQFCLNFFSKSLAFVFELGKLSDRKKLKTKYYLNCFP